MRIHIVVPYSSPAMTRMSGPLIHELPALYEITTSNDMDVTADLNIHVPFHTLCEDRDYGNGKHIAVYTHCNPGSQAELFKASQRADLITAMSFTGRRELLDMGIDPKKIWVIPCAADGFQYRPRRILVMGYPQPNGRKRQSLLIDLAFQNDLTPFEFILAGGGWEQVAGQLSLLGVKGQVVHSIDDAILATFYQTADVLLVTGYLEGGPLPLLEAMASGTRVLSPRFGYAADYLDEPDLYDTPEELMEKLLEMVDKSIHYHELVRTWSWQDYVAEYALMIGRLLDTSVDLYPERGMSRYAQLLDIIDRERPKSICEIGTWNGNTAIRMLQQAGKYRPLKRIAYQGFDLFDEQTGEQFVRELSKISQPLRVVQKRLAATGADVELVQGDTYDTLHRMNGADFIFIDGGHSEETIENDGSFSISNLKHEGCTTVVVFDDYYHEGQPDGMGCNKFIDGLDRNVYEVTHLPAHTRTEDGRLIGMVQVKRKDADLHLQMREPTFYRTVARDDGITETYVSYLSQNYEPRSTNPAPELERPAPA